VDVIVRSITVKFWKSCIEMVDTPSQRYRVAAVLRGVAILIRLLFDVGRTVVYHVDTGADLGWLYECPYSASIYPANTDYRLASNTQPPARLSTYYVADSATESCKPLASRKS
jgi:hypothetical protein